MKCSRCNTEVPSTDTSSCFISHLEITEVLPDISKERLSKLCEFDDLFFCAECMRGNICADCDKVLTSEEKEIIKNKDKF